MHHGESNTKGDGSYTSSYFQTLAVIIQDYRDEFGAVPFIVGQLDQGNDKNDKFNRAIKKVDDSNFPKDHVEWATAKNLTTFDASHFDAASTRLLGRRYAVQMEKLLGSM